MCGLVVCLRLDGSAADMQQVRRMTDAIYHRGPDDEGYFSDGGVGLGFRRLSILDLSPAGHQPMVSADNRFAIVFNGEIYNYLELRRELAARGHQFHSSGDTEVLLRAYLEWGRECVNRLNGMWAFVIFDKYERRLFGSRDRLGIKPLFRYRSASTAMFASEIKAIRASGEYADQTNWRVAADFLLRGALDRSAQCFFAGIEQVGAGCAFEMEFDGRYREWRYWGLDDFSPEEMADPAADYAELFEDAMRLHMRSDVPVGVHLSGGLDSTAIACAAARIRAEAGTDYPLMAFCFTPREFDESQYLEATFKQTAATPVLLNTDALKLWDDLPKVLHFQDEPVYSLTAVVGFQLMRLTAARGLKVVLNGQGADETAAGYPSYFINYWHSMLRGGRVREAWRELADYSRAHGEDATRLFLTQLGFLGRTLAARLPGWQVASRHRELRAFRSHRWLAPEMAHHVSDRLDEAPDYRLRSALVRSVHSDPLPRILRVEDRNSSAHSVEARVPFLDYRLVEFLFRLPDRWRMSGPWNKFIQREGMRGRIPEVVRARVDKMGFPVPSSQWFAGPLYEPLRDTLASRSARERGIYRVDTIVQDLDRHRTGQQEMSPSIFDVVQFELWCQQHDAVPKTATEQVAAG
ncbi:MAG: asparagine synthase (glutamine-hydrolyzing) [Burkholderiales bacterium]|nr:asparagine synthase (glutamine-hydrolyzing) [Burkholderiales bacterium]